MMLVLLTGLKKKLALLLHKPFTLLFLALQKTLKK